MAQKKFYEDYLKFVKSSLLFRFGKEATDQDILKEQFIHQDLYILETLNKLKCLKVANDTVNFSTWEGQTD